MPSLEVREFAKKINQLSIEDRQWLLQQLIQKIDNYKITDMSSDSSIEKTKKTFNISPAIHGSGYTDTAINHDEILVNSILGE